MIQIDDAGSGCLIGGTCIAAIRIETNEYFFDFIPVDSYSEINFSKKVYLDKSLLIVKNLLKKLNTDKNEKIEICQGYMFDKVFIWLENNKYNFVKTRIKDPLQHKIENTFANYVLDLGIPIQYIQYTRYPLHFHKILRWVYADYKNRSKLCKKGWKSWNKYGHLNLYVGTDYVYSDNFTCLKCNKKIKKGSNVKVIKYISNRPNTIYLHKKCYGP